MQSLTPIALPRVQSAAAQTTVAGDHSRTPLRGAEPGPRVRIDGRLFRVADRDWYLKGFTYGPFRPNRNGEHLPERVRMLEDFAHLRELGCNAIRLYHRPTVALLDDALE